jgi:hypothetical protein
MALVVFIAIGLGAFVPKTDADIETLLGQMTLDEKIGQMLQMQTDHCVRRLSSESAVPNW